MVPIFHQRMLMDLGFPIHHSQHHIMFSMMTINLSQQASLFLKLKGDTAGTTFSVGLILCSVACLKKKEVTRSDPFGLENFFWQRLCP